MIFIIINIFLITVAVVRITLLSSATPIKGIWYNKNEGDVLVFDDKRSVECYWVSTMMENISIIE